MLVNYTENVFFQKIWRLLLRASLTKDGLLLGLQKNFQARSGITEASIGFLAMIFVFMQDSATSHRAKGTLDFSETTRPISSAHKNGHLIRQI